MLVFQINHSTWVLYNEYFNDWTEYLYWNGWKQGSPYFEELDVYMHNIPYDVSTYRRGQKCVLDWKNGKNACFLCRVFQHPPGGSNASLILSKDLPFLWQSLKSSPVILYSTDNHKLYVTNYMKLLLYICMQNSVSCDSWSVSFLVLLISNLDVCKLLCSFFYSKVQQPIYVVKRIYDRKETPLISKYTALNLLSNMYFFAHARSLYEEVVYFLICSH